ncbi:MAG TPA: hypothetical protein VLA99_11665 [Nitrospiraceae bacterium]|nr:hypothetical protein [Nitrospiraceae bacterium]
MPLPMPRLYRRVILLLSLFLNACCLQNPSVYFSTGTTVGLEATPPVNDTPPAITFGYKRAEVALVPVDKLDKKKSPSSQGDASLPTGRDVAESSFGGCSETEHLGDSQHENPPKDNEPAGTTVPGSPPPNSSVTPSTHSDPGGHSKGKVESRRATSTDAFSVLAVFHLAVNWFGPAKIEQHFATGCAARNLIRGLTKEEEAKRLAEEAREDLHEASRLFQTSTDEREGAKGLKQQAEIMKTHAETTHKKATDAASDLSKEENKKALIESRNDATQQLTAVRKLQLKVRNVADSFAEAKYKAESAQHKAVQAMNTEEVRPGANQTKQQAEQIVNELKAKEEEVKTWLNEANEALKNALKLFDQVIKLPVKDIQ